MGEIVPTVLASSDDDLISQLDNIDFAEHIHIDFMDGTLTDTKSVALDQVTLPEGKIVDLHVMYDEPQNHLSRFIEMQPNMVIIQAESHCDIPKLAADLREHGIKIGLSVLPETEPESINYILPHVQQVLIFSGHLGHFGGKADLGLLDRIDQYKKFHKYLEFAWDGGANDKNVQAMARAGINIINVGGFIQKSDNPKISYDKLVKLIK